MLGEEDGRTDRVRLRFAFCAGHLSSYTPTMANHFFMEDLTLQPTNIPLVATVWEKNTYGYDGQMSTYFELYCISTCYLYMRFRQQLLSTSGR